MVPRKEKDPRMAKLGWVPRSKKSEAGRVWAGGGWRVPRHEGS